MERGESNKDYNIYMTSFKFEITIKLKKGKAVRVENEAKLKLYATSMLQKKKETQFRID